MWHRLQRGDRGIVPGRAQAEAQLTHQTISGWGGINEREGSVIELRNELRGQSFAGKVLVFPGARGSSGWSAYRHMPRLNGNAPAAMIFTRMTTKIALGAVVGQVPAATDLGRDPFELIETGDRVAVDAGRGTVTICRRVRNLNGRRLSWLRRPPEENSGDLAG